MIDLKYKHNNNGNNKFVMKIDDTYTIFADNIEDFKKELLDYIELQIDRFVLNKLDKIEEEEKPQVVKNDLDTWLRGFINEC